MAKESKLIKIISGISSVIISSVAGGFLTYNLYTPGTLNISKEKYTLVGFIAGGMMGAYLYYESLEKKKSNSEKERINKINISHISI